NDEGRRCRTPDMEMGLRHNTVRIRIFAGIVVILTIAAGVAVRRWLPWGFWSKYLGVALWSVVVYWLVGFIRPRPRAGRAPAIALIISWAVEFAQITPAPGWLSSKHAVLRMIFGEYFSFKDLPAYAIGVLLAAVTHASTVRRRPDL